MAKLGEMSNVKEWNDSLAELREEFAKWGINDFILPTKYGAAAHRGAVTLNFAINGKRFDVTCKRWTFGSDAPDKNLRALVMAVSAARKAHQRGIGEIFAQVASANLSLPPPSGAAPMGIRQDDPYEVLGISRTASRGFMKLAYRHRLKETHTDTGDVTNDDQFKRVQAAGRELGLVDSQGHLIE